MEIESEKKDKDIKETQNEKEIERLNRKLKRVMEEYAKCAKERDELRAAINAAERKKGRPGLSTEKKAQFAHFISREIPCARLRKRQECRLVQ